MKKVGMVFSGYRSEFVGMGKDIYDEYRVVQELFEEASHCLNNNFVKLCFASSDVEIHKIHNAYLSLFLVQASIVTLLMEKGIQPSLVAGVDVGELSAIYAAGGITFVDALYFINKYTHAYQELINDDTYGQMLVIDCSLDVLETLCKHITVGGDFVTISVYQSHNRFILSGTINALNDIKKVIKKSGAIVKKLKLGSGLHSFIMDDIVKSIKMHLEKIDIKSVQTPFVSAAIGQPLTDGEVILAALMQHIHAPSYFDSVITFFEECDVIIQAGPGDWLLPLFESIFPYKSFYKIENLSDIEKYSDQLFP